jgi:2-keto-4-pentenoate hydratase/2-oxohepta-3-ene-1,7-dioic acid hydratase in catechol pathway
MFGVGTFLADGDEPFPGLVVADAVVDLRGYFGPEANTGALFADWDANLERLREIASGDLVASIPLESLRPLPPVQPLGQFFCAGANYRKHLTEMVFSMARNDPQETRSDDGLRAEAAEFVKQRAESGMPFVFSAQPSAISGAQDDIVLWGPGTQHDWELELAVVIGRPARHVSVDEAMDYVAGYTMSNDISTRDVMYRTNFPMTDFLMTKGRPTFFPTGPYVVPKEFVEDYRTMRVTLKVNGEVMQDEGVDDIIYGVEEIVAYTSTVTDLYPGDLVLTGSPAGNAGHHGNRWLRSGDVVEGEITGLGVQRNLCVADPFTVTADHGYGHREKT